MSKPQIVLLPGAWHYPICFSLIIPKLEAAGYTVRTTHLPSVTDSNPPKDLSADIAAVRTIVDEAIGTGNDVIVIPHSWAGLVAASALVGYGKREREEKGEKGGVTRLGYMCAFIMPEGVSLMDNVEGKTPTWWSIEDDKFSLLADHAGDLFYSNLPESQRAHWFGKASRRHSIHTFNARATGEAWKQIPMHYLICEDDQVIPCVAQEAMTGMLKSMGVEISTERLNSDHSPFLSHVDDTVAWIRRVAGEQV